MQDHYGREMSLNENDLNKHKMLSNLVQTWSGVDKVKISDSGGSPAFARIPVEKGAKKEIALPMAKDWEELHILGKHESSHIRFSNAKIGNQYINDLAKKYNMGENFVAIVNNMVEDLRCETLFPRIFRGTKNDFTGYRRMLAENKSKSIDKERKNTGKTSFDFWEDLMGSIYIGEYDLADAIEPTFAEGYELGHQIRKDIIAKPSWLVAKECCENVLKLIAAIRDNADKENSELKTAINNMLESICKKDTSSKEGKSSETGKSGENENESLGRSDDFCDRKDSQGKTIEKDDLQNTSRRPDVDTSRTLVDTKEIPKSATTKVPSEGTGEDIDKDLANINKEIEKARKEVEMHGKTYEGNMQNMDDYADWNDTMRDFEELRNPRIIRTKPNETISLNRNSEEYTRRTYNETVRDYTGEITNLKRKLTLITTNSKYGATTSGKLVIPKAVGSVASSTYNPYMFKKRSVGREVDVLLLIDQSGSMATADKIGTARTATIVMAEALKKINGVKLCVQGHWVGDGMGDFVHYNHPTYKDFNDNDLYPIGSMQSHGDNHDGLHTRLSTRHLLQKGRVGARKVLVILCDGLPQDGAQSYSGRKALDDVRRSVVDAKRQGVIWITIALGVRGSHAARSEDFELMFGKDIVYVENASQLRNAFSQIAELVVRLTR